MNKKGFTLVELLAIITLLTFLLLLVFPNILEVSEKKEKEIDKAKRTLIENAAKEYMSNDINSYPNTIGLTYCFSLETLDKENLIPTDITKIKQTYKYITVKMGSNSNSYNLVKEKPSSLTCK